MSIITMNDLMNDLNQDDLKKIATSLGIGKRISRKLELMECIQDFLLHHLQTVVDRLSEDEKLLVAEIAFNETCEPLYYNAKYNRNCPYPPHYHSQQKCTPLLLLVSNQRGNDVTRIPMELIKPLRSLLPPPPESRVPTLDIIPEFLFYSDGGKLYKRRLNIYIGEQTVFQELKRMMTFVQAGKLTVMEKSKKPTPNTIKTVSNALLTPDFDLEVPIEERSEDNELVGPVRAYAWPILLQQTGWCKSLKGKLTTTSEGKEFMGHISTESFRQGIQRLLLNDEFDELNRIPNIKGQSGKGLWGCSRPSERKKWICQSISKWPIQKWIPFEEAFRFVYSSGLGYLVVRDAYHLYFSESRYGNLCGYEMEISKQYFRVFLFETLATLGIVDVGYCYPHWLWPEMSYCWGNEPLDFCGRYDGLQFVRLSQLGAFSLGLTDHFEIPKGEATERFKVLANHEIVLTGRHDGNSSNLHFLEMIADRNGEYSWRLEKKNILTFLETGGTIHEILDFLKQGISENIPRTVEVFLSDIGNKIGVFGKSEEAILVEINDPLTATLIANHSLTKKYCYQAGEHRLAILKKSQRAFRSALKKLGYILP